MKTTRFAISLVTLLLLASFQRPVISAASDGGSPLTGDALPPPPHAATLAAADFSPSRYQPSAFLAGRVAVQAIFVESDGGKEQSTSDWTPAQVSTIQDQLGKALEWWRTRLPNARLSFDLTSQIVPSDYEPIGHSLNTEAEWAGDTLQQMGFSGGNYFEQAYAANESLRRARHTDWATTIFVVNSAGKADGRFADGHFAYAYVGGPFLVVTSDAGPYGTNQMAPVVAHEFGHIFGALDQYAAASTPCTQQSGYLAIPTTNSQSNNCGSRFICIMLEPLTAFSAGQIDTSALGQIGYRDSDGNGIPDPLDTTPASDLRISQPNDGSRPIVTGSATDQPYPSPMGESTTINTITRIEYRADGGDWIALPPADGAYDSSSESVNTPLALYDGPHTLELRAINSIGAASPLTTANVIVHGVGPAPLYNISAPAINSTGTITVAVTAPVASAAQISEDPFFSAAGWAPVEPSTRWQFAPNDGEHTLYVRFRDSAGLESPPFARAVLVDRSPPTGRVVAHSDQSPWLEIQAKDNVSGIAAMQIISDGDSADWQPFQSSLSVRSKNTHFQVRLRDVAGNVSAPLRAITLGPIYLPLALRPVGP
jgi:hypothetical protein